MSSYLTDQTGRTWSVKKWNDDLENGVPSFDLRLTDGLEDVLVEVTRLTDGPEFSGHDENVESLFRSLAPDPERSYCLFLPPPFLVRLDRRQARQLKRSIKCAAIELRVGDKVPVPIARRGTLKLIGEAVPGYIACHHGDNWLLDEFSSEASGVYFLYDDWRFDHQFLTAECQAEYRRRLVKACLQSREKGPIEVEWQEEWELQRLRDPAKGEGGVLVISFVADFIESAAIQSVHQGLEHGKEKLQMGRDEAKAAIALHAGEHQHTLSLKQYEDAITSLSATDVWPLDKVFLLDGDRVHRCFNYDHPNVSPRAISALESHVAKT